MLLHALQALIQAGTIAIEIPNTEPALRYNPNLTAYDGLTGDMGHD